MFFYTHLTSKFFYCFFMFESNFFNNKHLILDSTFFSSFSRVSNYYVLNFSIWLKPDFFFLLALDLFEIINKSKWYCVAGFSIRLPLLRLVSDPPLSSCLRFSRGGTKRRTYLAGGTFCVRRLMFDKHRPDRTAGARGNDWFAHPRAAEAVRGNVKCYKSVVSAAARTSRAPLKLWLLMAYVRVRRPLDAVNGPLVGATPW